MADHEQGLTTADIAGSSEHEPDGSADGRVTDAAMEDSSTAPLLPADETERFTSEWKSVQGSFVDRPREAVEQADRLVADLMQRLASQFSDTRAGLEKQWDGQEDISTEDLRVALTRYRTFFERLLSA